MDATIIKDLSEIIGKNLNFTDIELLGKYFFKEFSAHKVLNVRETQSISPLNASGALVQLAVEKGRLEELLQYIIELDGSILNGKTVKLTGLENLLYKLTSRGIYFDFNKRKFVKVSEDKELLPNWGSLKDGKEYKLIVASIDICGNSELVKKYNTNIMEKVYFQLHEYIKKKIYQYNGRIWSWAGDGGLIAFQNDERGTTFAVSCCMEILFSLPVFNYWYSKPISDEIKLRIGMDTGLIKFFLDTGRIVSDVINYATHLEKKGTEANGLSISETVFNELNEGFKKFFKNKTIFEGKTAYSLVYNYEKAIF